MQWLDVLQRLHIARIDTMKLLTDLFTTDYGLMSAAGIAFMLGMGVWFRMFFKRKMDEDAKNAAA
jgi:hypothetical protein